MNDIPLQKWLPLYFERDTSFDGGEGRLIRLCGELGKSFNDELASVLLSFITRKVRKGEWESDTLLADLTYQADTSETAEYLAIALEAEKNRERVSKEFAISHQLEQLEEFENRHGLMNASLFGEEAKLNAQIGDYPTALKKLQMAFSLFPDFSFWIRHQSTTNLLLKEASPSLFRRELNVGVIGSCTTSFLTQFLRSAGLARGLKLNIYEGPFGNYAQEILDPKSGLYRSNPDAVFWLLESHDFNADQLVKESDAQRYADRIRSLRERFRERSSAQLIQTGLEIPVYGGWGGLEYSERDGRVRRLEQLNLMLSENLPDGVTFLHPRQLAALHPGNWVSSRDWYVAKQYPAPEALPVLADAVAANLAAVAGLNKRVLVLDLDNTCWGGVIGEDGLAGIKVGNSFSEGESYSALQRYAKELQQKGILLAVCSKNNENDALLPFTQRSEMILKRDDFVAFRANWKDKATNLRSIAAELSLGLDTFVFVDDNPVERALVRKELPEVTVPEFDNLHWKIVPVLRRGMYFETNVLTEEDRRRHESYRLRSLVASQSAAMEDLDDFLRSLSMKSSALLVDSVTLPRVTQLLNKSNQFNLTTRRFTQEEVRQMAESRDWWCRAFTLQDSFQDHGIVGILLAKRTSDVWSIDSLVMSCRVIGRKLEDYMLSTLIHSAVESGAKEIHGLYRPTPKNGLVRDFYPDHHFTSVPDQPGYWRLSLEDQPLIDCDVITEGKKSLVTT